MPDEERCDICGNGLSEFACELGACSMYVCENCWDSDHDCCVECAEELTRQLNDDDERLLDQTEPPLL